MTGEPAPEAGLQEPGSRAGRQPQLDGHGNIKEAFDLCLLNKQQEQVDGRGQIVSEQSDVGLAQGGTERVPEAVVSCHAVLQIGIEIQILDIGVRGSKGIAAEGSVMKKPVKGNRAYSSEQCRQQAENKSF